MVGMTGFEPATSRPPGVRSAKLSYIPLCRLHRAARLVGRAGLEPAETFRSWRLQRRVIAARRPTLGRRDRNRTDGILRVKEALCLAELHVQVRGTKSPASRGPLITPRQRVSTPRYRPRPLRTRSWNRTSGLARIRSALSPTELSVHGYCLVRLARFELTTPAFGGQCSIRAELQAHEVCCGWLRGQGLNLGLRFQRPLCCHLHHPGKSAVGGTRTLTAEATSLSDSRVYRFHHDRSWVPLRAP
jgi:hypothetical protein